MTPKGKQFDLGANQNWGFELWRVKHVNIFNMIAKVVKLLNF